jgi:hypothetical protein
VAYRLLTKKALDQLEFAQRHDQALDDGAMF